jgi:hypothetical protein
VVFNTPENFEIFSIPEKRNDMSELDRKTLNKLGARYVDDPRNPEKIKPNDYVIFKRWGKERIGLVQSLAEEFGMAMPMDKEDQELAEEMKKEGVDTVVPSAPPEHTLGASSAGWNPYNYLFGLHKRSKNRLVVILRTKTGNYEKAYLSDCKPIQK